MSVRATALAAVVALSSTGCMSLAPQSPILIGAAQSGGIVHLHRGDTLVVALAADPAVAGRWRVQPLQGPVLEQIGMADLLPARVAEGTTGAANDAVYRFRASAVGTTTLELVRQPAASETAGAAPPGVHYRVSVSDIPGEYAQAWTNSR